jgi:hypothetical protein
MSMQVFRYAQRPELWSDTATITREVWPEYNPHGEDPNGYWDRLLDEFPEFQFVLFDDSDLGVIAEGHTTPCDWDGTPEGLGDGINAMLAAAFEAPEADGHRRRCARWPPRSGRASKAVAWPTGCWT